MSEELANRLQAVVDRRHLLIGLPMIALGLLVVALALLSSRTVHVEIGEPNERRGQMGFVDGRVDIYSGPGPGHDVINFLPPGQPALIGEPEANGWAPLLDPVGDTIGYIDSGALADYPPPRPGRQFELEGLVVPIR